MWPMYLCCSLGLLRCVVCRAMRMKTSKKDTAAALRPSMVAKWWSDISENGLLYKCGNQLHFYPSSKRNSWNCTYHRSTKEEQDKYDLEESFLVGSFTRWSI